MGSSAAAMSPAAPSATAPFALRTRLVDNESSAEKVLAVQCCDGLFGFGIIANLGESEPARLPGKAISKQGERIRLNSNFRKQRLHLLFGGSKGEIAHIEFLHDRAPWCT